MIKVAMFDLGMTLIDDSNQPFKHVRAALTKIASLKTADAKRLSTCLVSDFNMADPPVTAQKVDALFQQYLDILDETGLRPYFEPVKKRVTLSTHAGVMKPARLVFEFALHRLNVEATLEECLLVTENAAHIKFAKTKLHMRTLQFRAGNSSQFDFEDWARAPAIIAKLVKLD